MLTVLLLLATFGQDVPRPVPKPAIRLPELSVPTPTPVSPDAVQVLKAGELFIVDSDFEIFLRQAPPGVLKIKSMAGPRSFYAVFAGGTGEPEERDYAGKFLYVLTATKTARCELFVIPKGVDADNKILQRTIDAQVGPRPPPPDPEPDPEPPKPPTPVDPSPFPDAGFRCLIVYETKDLAKLPTVQEQIIYSKTVRDYLNAKAVAGSDGKTKEWRIYDKDIDLSADSKVWQDAMKRPRQSVPWVLIGNGQTGFEGPLPADVPAMLTLLKKYGGA